MEGNGSVNALAAGHPSRGMSAERAEAMESRETESYTNKTRFGMIQMTTRNASNAAERPVFQSVFPPTNIA